LPRTLVSFSEQNGIAGTLPFEMNRLQSLRFLLLEEGILTGPIPSELGDIRTLELIDLNFNLLTGTIPETIYTLPSLQQLDLNDNEFVGTISTAIGQLSPLLFFQVDNNRMTGTIPTELGRLQLLGKREKGEIGERNVAGVCSFCPESYQSLVPFLSWLSTEVATMNNNMLSGTMPAQVCRNTTGALLTLTTDCLGAPNRPSPPLVVCACCSACF
jgi:hypothetical protein